MNYTYLVPKDTARSLDVGRCQNFGLLLQRYSPHEAIKPTDRQNDKGKAVGKERNFWLQYLCRGFEPDIAVLEAVRDRWLAMTADAARFALTARSRMVIGLGGKGALEFGLTLSKVTGLPYIPGSALKGLCRSYMLLSIAEERGIEVETQALSALEESLLHAEGDKRASRYQALFGTQEGAGHVVFYDGCLLELPESERLFVPDVMTPHFSEYYRTSGNAAPHDGDSPVPVTFVTIAEGCRFGFAAGLRHPEPDNADAPLLEFAAKLMHHAITELGVGAKTAAGYGVLG